MAKQKPLGTLSPSPEAQGLEAWASGPRNEPNCTPEQPARERKTPRGLDPELQAMAKIDRILADLDDDDAKGRIMCWLWDRVMHTDPVQHMAPQPPSHPYGPDF